MGKATAGKNTSLLLQSSWDRHHDYDDDKKISCLAGFWQLCRSIIRRIQKGTGEPPSDPDSAYFLINLTDYNSALPPYSDDNDINNDQDCIEEPELTSIGIGTLDDEIEKAVVVVEEEPPRPPPLFRCRKRARLGPYSWDQNILLVGEGDFSFSASLAVAFGDATNIVATSLDSYEFLMKNYGKAASNIGKLRSRNCKLVLHGVDATKMAHHPQLRSLKFDRVVYNFPHAGFTNRSAPRHAQIKTHQELVKGFLENAKKMIKEEDGEIHITHKCVGFFLDWNLAELGKGGGLRLVEDSPFDFRHYPGYTTKFGFGGNANFKCCPAKTYKFQLPTPNLNNNNDNMCDELS